MLRPSHTIRHLISLLLVGILGIALLIITNVTFNNLLSKLDSQTHNLQSKIKIGEFIVNDLRKVRSDFYELATTASNKHGRDLIQKRMHKSIQEIHNAIKVLQHGGTLYRVIRLNLVEQTQTIKKITYVKKDLSEVSLEAIDIQPKLLEFQRMNKTMQEMLTTRDQLKRANNKEEFFYVAAKIKRFYKSSPSFFTRIIENTSRLHYEGEQELKVLQQQIQSKKNSYMKLELILVFVIVALMAALGYIISQQINKNSKDLESQEASTRGILDAQPNIIVVSDGEEMIDANLALVDFFEGYNSFEDFKSKHACICDYFEDLGTDEYVIDKEYEEGLWYEHILAHPDKLHKVAMKGRDGLHYFTIYVSIKAINNEEFIVIIALNDITKELQNQEELKLLNNNLENIIEDKTKSLQDLNDTLELKIKEEVEKNRQKDKKMIEQSRYAALGEMIANIAHQWRQPLSAISSTASGTRLQIDMKLIDYKGIQSSFLKIQEYVDFLNQTIEDFRAFFKKDKDLVRFDVAQIIEKSLNITRSAYKDNEIELFVEVPKDELNTIGFPNELAQVIINILNNARDALVENQIFNKQVYIHGYKQDDHIVINFYDNAGGIPDEIMGKIFDPYFTTKHQSQGTGIGLYMSKDIIEKNMKGHLSVENRSFTVHHKNYYGACFSIHIPIVEYDS